MANRVSEYLDSNDVPSSRFIRRLVELQKVLYAAADTVPEFTNHATPDEQKDKAQHYRDLAFFTGLLKGAAEKTGVRTKMRSNFVTLQYDIDLKPTLRKNLIRGVDLQLAEEVRNNFNDGIEQPNLADQITIFATELKKIYLSHSAER